MRVYAMDRIYAANVLSNAGTRFEEIINDDVYDRMNGQNAERMRIMCSER